MNYALLTAGGIGSRMHMGIPKQFLCVNNKPIIIYAMEAFQIHPSVDGIYVACLEGWENVLEAYAKQYGITKLKKIVIGGETGQESIYNGLKAIQDDSANTTDVIVIVHDGNRPMVSQDLITNGLIKQKEKGSAVAAIPTTEVVFSSEDGLSSTDLLDRDKLWRTQTPHIYRFDDLWEVHNLARKDRINNMAASCSLMHYYGHQTYFFVGSELNLKITTQDDLAIFKAMLDKGLINND